MVCFWQWWLPAQVMQGVLSRSAREEGISQAELQGGSRRGRVPEVRIKIARKLVKEEGVIMAEAARHLGVSTSALSKAIK
jgi:putative transposase